MNNTNMEVDMIMTKEDVIEIIVGLLPIASCFLF